MERRSAHQGLFGGTLAKRAAPSGAPSRRIQLRAALFSRTVTGPGLSQLLAGGLTSRIEMRAAQLRCRRAEPRSSRYSACETEQRAPLPIPHMDSRGHAPPRQVGLARLGYLYEPNSH